MILRIIYLGCALFVFNSFINQLSEYRGNTLYYKSINKDSGFVTSYLKLESEEFLYLRQGCEGYTIGSGTTSISDSTIELEFNSSKCSSFEIYEYDDIDSRTDSITVRIRVFDRYDGVNLSQVSCGIRELAIGAITNEYGVAEIMLPKGEVNIHTLEIYCPGYNDNQVLFSSSYKSIEIQIKIGLIEYFDNQDEISFIKNRQRLYELIGDDRGHRFKRVSKWDLHDFFQEKHLLEELSCLKG